MVLSLQFVRIHFTFNDNNSIKGKTKKKKKRSLYMVRLCAARCLCQLFDICFAPQKLALRGKCAVNVQAIETIIKKKKKREMKSIWCLLQTSETKFRNMRSFSGTYIFAMANITREN